MNCFAVSFLTKSFRVCSNFEILSVFVAESDFFGYLNRL